MGGGRELASVDPDSRPDREVHVAPRADGGLELRSGNVRLILLETTVTDR